MALELLHILLSILIFLANQTYSSSLSETPYEVSPQDEKNNNNEKKLDIKREITYETPLAKSPLLEDMLKSLSKQKHSPSPTQTPDSILQVYDYIIVGAGSAGSTVAARLSEISCVNILLLEAGKEAPLLTEIPGIADSFFSSDIAWPYSTVPQKHAGRLMKHRRLPMPSGKTIGGTSTINGMLYVRGNKQDYDGWLGGGAVGWGYKDVLPYFKKMEDNRNFQDVDEGYHGKGGQITVSYPNYESELKAGLMKAATDFGYEIMDSNGYKQAGFYKFQADITNGQRCSTAKAYLVPAEKRANLHILPEAFVKKINIKNKTASEVLFEVNGTEYEIKASREIIISAGAIKTPQLLMLSGIGPKSELMKHKIPVIADLPVGRNLHDHCSTTQFYEMDSSIPNVKDKLSNENNIQDYIDNRRGPLASPELKASVAFLKGRKIFAEFDDPSYQMYIVEHPPIIAGLDESIQKDKLSPHENKTIYACVSEVLQPLSRGTITLNSTNPQDPPLIDPNYLAEKSDLENIVTGMGTCEKFAMSDAMLELGTKPLNISIPGCEEYLKRRSKDKFFECYATAITSSSYHPVGTSRMGNPEHKTTVVDSQLRVKGINNLRVVDASVMPMVTSGNTNIPTIMIAEKASDMIKQTIACI